MNKKIKDIVRKDDLAKLQEAFQKNAFTPDDVRILLQIACNEGKEKCALALIEEIPKKPFQKFLDVRNYRSKKGLDSCFFRAASFGGSINLVKALFSQTDLEKEKEYGQSVVLAAQGGHIEILKFLFEKNLTPSEAVQNAFCWSIFYDNKKVFSLLKKHVNPKAEKSIALQWAFKYGRRDMLKKLIIVSDVEVAIKELTRKWPTDPIVWRELKAYEESQIIKKQIRKTVQKKEQTVVAKRKM